MWKAKTFVIFIIMFLSEHRVKQQYVLCANGWVTAQGNEFWHIFLTHFGTCGL